MQSRINELKKLGIPTEFHAYGGVERGVGLGTGTAAYGWLNRAVAFWEKNVTIHPLTCKHDEFDYFLKPAVNSNKRIQNRKRKG